jgi:ribulose-phosphate 3-epimerase
MNMELLIAIIPDKIEDLKKETALLRGLVDWVQIDIMDGVFVPPITWPYSAGNVSELEEVSANWPNIELHFMVQDPETILDQWVGLGVRRILMHAESTDKMGTILARLKYTGIEAGIALDLETPVSVIDPYVNDIKVVQLMSIGRLGYHGEPFNEKAIGKIRTLRARYPDLVIQVDGGINLETGRLALEAGANNLVVGSAILKSQDIKKTINEFKELGR